MIHEKDEVTSFALIQPDLIWEDPSRNIQHFETQLNKIKPATDLVALPETFATGFTMNVEKYADEKGEILKWMQEKAISMGIHFTGSVIVKEGQHYYNRLYWITPNGDTEHYDKRHLFRMGREEKHFTPGNERKIVQLGDTRILLQICYDIRFPVFARNRDDYDIIIYVANWPSARQNVWETLLAARAIENLSFVIGVNRTGIDGEGVEHAGSTQVVHPYGHKEAWLNDQPGLLNFSIDRREILKVRDKFPAYKDADDFTLRL